MKEWIKRNWKICLIVLLILFSLTKCSQSCNRNIQLKQQLECINHKDSIIADRDGTLINKDSIIRELTLKNEHLIEMLNSEKQYSVNFSDIAFSNQRILIDENKRYKNENAKLRKQLDSMMNN